LITGPVDLDGSAGFIGQSTCIRIGANRTDWW